MIKGIGIGLVDKDRFNKLLAKFGNRVAQKVLSYDERNEYENIDDKTSFLSKRFAAKEALSKAFGSGLYRNGVYPTLISVKHNENGKPFFEFRDSLNFYVKNNFSNIQLSITDSDSESIALVVAE